jgi:hypothetical protein
MPRGWRLRPGGGPTPLAVAAGVALVLALVVTGRQLSGSGLRNQVRPPGTTAVPVPYRVDERPACPHSHPVLATSDGRSHPPGHPTPPARSAEAVACYESVALAAADGYAEASGYVGAYPEVGRRLMIAAAREPAAAAVACAGLRPVGRARVRGRDGGRFRCPPGDGPHRDGLLLRWRERGLVMAVSVTGRPVVDHRLVAALAVHLELVPPADGGRAGASPPGPAPTPVRRSGGGPGGR